MRIMSIWGRRQVGPVASGRRVLPIAEGREVALDAFIADMRVRVTDHEPETLQFDMFRVRAGQDNHWSSLGPRPYADQAAWEAYDRLRSGPGIVGKTMSFRCESADFKFLEPVMGRLRHKPQ